MSEYPSYKEQLRNLLTAFGRMIDFYLIDDEEKSLMVTPKEYESRTRLCKSCDHVDKVQKRCKLCGCFIPTKARMNTESCPIGKWGVDNSKEDE